MSCTAGMAQFSERLCLNLTDSLTGNIELLADFFKRSASSVVKTEAKLDNVLFTECEGVELTLENLSEDRC